MARKPRTPKNVVLKTREMIGEGYRPTVAAAAAYSMRRRGKLGPKGGYERVGKSKRGPLGRMRRVM